MQQLIYLIPFCHSQISIAGVTASFAKVNSGDRSSMATLFYSGPERMEWEKSQYKADGQGPSVIEATIYKFRHHGDIEGTF